eukprot:s988_g10.t1
MLVYQRPNFSRFDPFALRPHQASPQRGAGSSDRWAVPPQPVPQHGLFGDGGRKVRGLTEEELYDELSGWEDPTFNQALEDPEKLQRRRQTEGQLRQEVDKLREAGSEFQLGLVKRQLQSLKRGTSAASGLAQRCRDCQRKAELFDLEREALQKEAAMKKKAWQEPRKAEIENAEAEQEAAHLADQLASLEQQKAKSALARSSIRQQAAASQAADGEAAQLLAERTELQQRLRKTRERRWASPGQLGSFQGQSRGISPSESWI